MTVYDEVGGADGLRTAVAVLYARVVVDPELMSWFDGVDLTRLRAHQQAFLAAVLGGPDAFSGRDIAEAHRGLGVDDAAFDALVAHLEASLEDLGVAPSTVRAVAPRLEAFRTDIVASRVGSRRQD